ncbi:response regulator [Pelagibius litoralis]|uniref:Regulatory protein VirG n=1 Tax=Pelagibius litoralis TaxID=374515 RepID=A0A967EYX9_9PROT|nr:response regulator [Pelagibius litoralis]NIA70023.1 response regulator [Pelagibius litoralis]
MDQTPHILVVDDHRDIRDLLGKYLAKNGLRVSLAENAAAARRVMKTAAIDLLVLDIMMPGEDGLALCRDLRANSEIPIILVTAMTEETDRVIGLEIGADDYVTKPFNPRELLARIKAVLRRSTAVPRPRDGLAHHRLRFDRWILDAERRELLDEEAVAVALSTAEFNLLSAFLKRPGVVLSREQLLDLTSGRAAQVFDRSIDNQVSRLRKKIETDAKHPVLIKTVWGGGYLFTADVREEP